MAGLARLLLSPAEGMAVWATSSSSLSFRDVKKFTLIFPLNPLKSAAPTAPPAYIKSPLSTLKFAMNSTGYIMLTRHDFGALGVLTELMYFPGQSHREFAAREILGTQP